VIKNGPKVIHLDITGKCNLLCRHCRASLGSSRKREPDLSVEEYGCVISRAKEMFPNFERLYLSGGEPLLDKRKLFTLIDLAKKINLWVAVNTNGTLIDKKDIRNLKKCNGVQISLDGAKEETHDFIRRVRGSFDKAVKSIELLARYGIKLNVRITLNEYNIAEIGDLHEFCKKLGVKLSFYRTIPTGSALSGNLLPDFSKYNTLLRTVLGNRREIDTTDPIKIIYLDSLANDIKKKYRNRGVISGCIAGVGELFIDYRGNIFPCTMLSKKLGNAVTGDLKGIWVKSAFLNHLRDRLSFSGACGQCKYVALCGGCRAYAKYFYGSYFAEDPVCIFSQNKKYRKIAIGNIYPCKSC